MKQRQRGYADTTTKHHRYSQNQPFAHRSAC
jgi:hypothetical protein